MVIQVEDAMMGCHSLPQGGAMLMIKDVETSVQIAIGLDREAGEKWATEIRRKTSGLKIVGPNEMPGNQ
jgi:hypothetical protein